MTKTTYNKLYWVLMVCAIGILMSIAACTGNNAIKNDSKQTAALDSLYYPLDSIDSNGFPIHVCASADGNMKFYSWNTGEGGTCPDFGILCQFHTNDGGSKIVDVSDEIGWVDRVYSIKKDDGSTYYLAVSFHQASSDDGYSWATAYRIYNDTIKQVAVIDAAPLQDQDENDFTVNYSIHDWYDATNGEGENWIHEYDSDTRNLYVPQTIEVAYASEISDWYRVYHFNGKRFEDKGIKPHKGLHKSLANYKQLQSYFKTKHHIVRIDELTDGTLRYASWKSSSTVSDKPELVIMGGKYDKEERTYTFTNKGVTYIAGYLDCRMVNDDEYCDECLLIKRNGKVISKQKYISPFDDKE